MSYETIARRYSRAVFEIGKEAGNLPSILKDLTSFGEAYAGSEELTAVLTNPLVPGESREAIIKDVGARLGLGETAVGTLRLLARRGRIAVLPALEADLSRLIDEDTKVVRASVTSAVPLSEAYAKKLQAEIEKATGSRVVLTREVDPSLVIGVVTRIGDRVIDGSARARLAHFRESLQS